MVLSRRDVFSKFPGIPRNSSIVLILGLQRARD